MSNFDRDAEPFRPRRVPVLAAAAALVLVLAALTLPGAARAAETLDQEQDLWNGYFPAVVSQTPAQVFTAGRSGVLTQVDLYLFCGADGPPAPTVKIEPLANDGSPSGTALADATTPAQCAPGWVPFQFANQPVVQAGTQYAIVAESDASLVTWPRWDWAFEWFDPFEGAGVSNPYPGGSAWARVNGVWFEEPDRDMTFKTYVRPAVEAGFLAPLDESTDAGTVVNTARNGRVVPVKVQLDQDGAAITDANAPGPVTLVVTDLGVCGGGSSTDPVEVYAAGSSSGDAFRYDATAGAWLYNLDTRKMGLASGHCYRLDVLVNGIQAENAWAILQPVR